MKILAIDHGTKRIGLAVSDYLGISAKALPPLKNDDKLFKNILGILEAENCQKIIIGMPLGFKENSNQEMIVKDFAEKLRLETNVEIEFWDETYTTKSAKLLPGLSKSASVDSHSAKLILLEYLRSINP